jgi:glycosyltransferase involved in cell wall biosynthesis
MKIVLVTNIIAPYRIPMFNAFSAKLGGCFSVWFMRETEPNRHWRVAKQGIAFPYQVLAGTTLTAAGNYCHINPGFLARLFHERPDVVVMGGYNSLHYLAAAFYAKYTGSRLVLWSETHFDSSRSNSGLVRRLKSSLIRMADAFLTPSRRGQDYLEAYGADSRACFRLYNCVDPKQFGVKDVGTRSYRPPRLLFVGSLDERKGLRVALQALAGIDREWTLTVAGSGPEEERLREQAQQLGIGDRVEFLGFVDNHRIAAVYGRCNYFILPTFSDPCPLVVNEALAAGLFCILSRHAGNAEEFITEGRNGVVFDPHDVQAMRAKILEAFDYAPSERVITESIWKASPEHVAEAFAEAMHSVASPGLRLRL